MLIQIFNTGCDMFALVVDMFVVALYNTCASLLQDLFSFLRQMHLTGASNGLNISNKIEIQTLPQERALLINQSNPPPPPHETNCRFSAGDMLTDRGVRN